MLYSILQIIAFQALFLLIYDLFLKRETFFNYNRAYLIITSVLALVLPFLKFPQLKTMATKDMVIHLPEVFIGTKAPTVYDIQTAELAGIILEQPQTPIWQIIAVTGIAIASLIFLAKITKLYWLKHKNPKRWKGNVLIVKLIKSSAAFSFFNTIFLGEHISESEKPTIYKHELVHIEEYHTVDLLFFEMLRVVFWFNPLVYIYQNRIKELHEYIADAKAVKQSGKAEYYTTLLNQVLDVNQVSFTNTFFNKSLIKKRIAMLQKSKSKQLHLLKYALLIPMVFGMLIYTSTEVRAQQKIDSQETLVDQELTDAELIKKYYDKIVTMKKNGTTFFDISNFAGFKNYDIIKYLPSRTEFLKMKAYGQYISDDIIQRKSEEGTLTQKDINTVSLMRLDKFETYEDFKAFKNTKAEKERWESNTQDGILKLYVEDTANKTVEETKRYNGLLKQLENDDFFNKLVVTDGRSTLVLDSYISNDGVEIIKEEVEIVEVPFSVVEETPTTIDCQDLESNKDRKDCFNSFVNKHIAKNFNTSIGDSLSPGRKRVFVQFKVDKDGTVKHIVARGPSPELEIEAKRVIATLPQFIPGKQKGKLVVVPFSIPIVFQVQGDANSQEYNELVAKRDSILKNSTDKNPIIEQLNQQINELKTNKKVLSIKDMEKYAEESIAAKKKRLNGAIPFSEVEIAPIHPDCKSISNDAEQKDCLASAINKLVGKNFDTNLANSLGLAAGQKRIYAQFIIDKTGHVTSITARGPHPKLETETIRVLNLLPNFTPAKKGGEDVAVSYALPIVFQIHDSKKD
ncbi:M56 family metallopeptidase [Winogradskyella thalassocola]|uniref:Signal transducer regulating beta-lactamase production, contains metallopeptidase domain n=1 Tax=Winogradskyella thalassocola TaxID=262004 RepID=A0A1G7Y244_9FLAO|nr:M56 family metallopeptidase [Winogradskyella thalassocola]SDG90477.1 Signal transducer regulating beta-lactamase production, contains metallopeptidase domain [Winogradskyella thalassocola]